MKRFLMIAMMLAVAASAAAQSASVGARDLATVETVSVSGTGRTRLAPDRFSFTVGVQTMAATVEDSVRQNSQRVADVIAALKKAGATDKDVRTANFSIYPQQDYSQGQLPRILGYQVNNSVTVTRSNVSEAGKLLQTAVSAGVNTSSGLQFEISDPARGRDEGLRAAFADAKAKAGTLAQAAGRNLGRALAISEGGATPPPMVYAARTMAMKAEAASDSVPVEAGTQESVYNISVVFELK